MPSVAARVLLIRREAPPAGRGTLRLDDDSAEREAFRRGLKLVAFAVLKASLVALLPLWAASASWRLGADPALLQILVAVPAAFVVAATVVRLFQPPGPRAASASGDRRLALDVVDQLEAQELMTELLIQQWRTEARWAGR